MNIKTFLLIKLAIMKTLFYSLFVMCMFLFVTSCTQDDFHEPVSDVELSVRGASIQKVTGQVSVTAPNGDMDWRTFSVQAQKDRDGSVSGKYRRVRRIGGNANHEFTDKGDVICMDTDGTYANLILQEENEEGETEYFYMRLYDGGNGKGVDSITLHVPFADPEIIDAICDVGFSASQMYIGEAGNIKIH